MHLCVHVRNKWNETGWVTQTALLLLLFSSSFCSCHFRHTMYQIYCLFHHISSYYNVKIVKRLHKRALQWCWLFFVVFVAIDVSLFSLHIGFWSIVIVVWAVLLSHFVLFRMRFSFLALVYVPQKTVFISMNSGSGMTQMCMYIRNDIHRHGAQATLTSPIRFNVCCCSMYFRLSLQFALNGLYCDGCCCCCYFLPIIHFSFIACRSTFYVCSNWQNSVSISLLA